MGVIVDMIGKKFNRLTCVKKVRRRGAGRAYWYLFRCDCGVEIEIIGSAARSGKTKSCGCLKIETAGRALTTHGHAAGKQTPTYRVWKGMIGRCTNPKGPRFKDYGGRGIKVCRRWRHSFENFLKDMGEKPAGLTLDRKNNDGDYSPKNCRWATRVEQANNTSANRLITHNGTTKSMAAWARHFNIKMMTLVSRVDRSGWSFAEAVSRPIGPRHFTAKQKET